VIGTEVLSLTWEATAQTGGDADGPVSAGK
jgi:hypothetical protein